MPEQKRYKASRFGDGEYAYRGRIIYRRDPRRGAYNPWRIALGPRFRTLKEAKDYIDGLREKSPE